MGASGENQPGRQTVWACGNSFSAGSNSSRISSRPALSNHTFQPPQELYPGCALPPPVYSNLTELANAAKRKFSIQQEAAPPTQPSGTAEQHKGQSVPQRRQTMPHIFNDATSAGGKSGAPSVSSDMSDLDRAVCELDQLTSNMMAGGECARNFRQLFWCCLAGNEVVKAGRGSCRHLVFQGSYESHDLLPSAVLYVTFYLSCARHRACV